ncbi:MAG TPA: glutathione S-transferase family protein, partial [Geminicoccaceae bacterium]|nr:glutathione S-transferase family protein [Geminicoccaceae bacterium]
MHGLRLVIGSKNASSWSLRPWLLLKEIGLAFEEVVVPLRRPDTTTRILAHSPSGKVPVLIVGDLRIWDSLAIAEFLAEHEPSLWPAEPRARALARSISAEMHSGFQALRTFLPMDFAARFDPPGRLLAPVQADVARILEIWTECRLRHGRAGPFLFGTFTIADAMFAPVCSRFATHAVPIDPLSQAYVDHVMALPAMLEWGRAAAAEVGTPRPMVAPAGPEPGRPRQPSPEFAGEPPDEEAGGDVVEEPWPGSRPWLPEPMPSPEPESRPVPRVVHPPASPAAPVPA